MHQKVINWTALTICQPNLFVEQTGTRMIRYENLPSQYRNNKTEIQIL